MHDSHDRGAHNFEQTDVHPKLVLVSGILFVVLCLLGAGTGLIIMRGFQQTEPMTDYQAHPMSEQAFRWNTPVRLQVNPALELGDYRAQHIALISEYKIISEMPEVYQIPVDVAMQVVATRGLPEFEGMLSAMDTFESSPADDAAQAPADQSSAPQGNN